MPRPKIPSQLRGGGGELIGARREFAYAKLQWSRSEPRYGQPRTVHLLALHLADVRACSEVLLARPTIRGPVARSADLEALYETGVARPALFADLYDIGRASIGFQSKKWRDVDVHAGSRKTRRPGHTQDLPPVCAGDNETAAWLFDSLG